MLAKIRIHLIAGFLLIALLLCEALPATAQALPQGQVPSRITAPVDNAVRATIAGTTHPLAQAQFDRGPVDPGLPMERMILVLSPSSDQEQQLRTLLDSQQTQGSPDYHHWLTPEEFGQKFGPSPQDIQQITAWLERLGFRVGSVAKGGRWIEFSGTAEQVQAAFQTQMRNYQVNGEMHLANASDISVPTALSPVVRGVSLHNFFSKPMHRQVGTARRTGSGSYGVINPDGTFNGGLHALAPGDFANIYDLNPLYNATPTHFTGTGQIIGIVARSNIGLGDMIDFQSAFGLPSNPPNVILNGPDARDVPGDDVEATLDVEWSGAVAPGATIDIVVSASTATSDGVDLSSSYIVDNNLAPVMSVSFNLCEQLLGTTENLFINALAQQAAAQGISVFVAAGDDGAAACDDPNNSVATGPVSVGGLSSPPYVTAVGGTEFDEALAPGGDATFWNTTNSSTLVSAKGYIPEMVWNESCSVAVCGAPNANLFAGSGGVSTIYGTPSWQNSTGIPGLNFATRALPDVSLAAAGGHDGFLLCFQRVCVSGTTFDVVGGTSASSPSMAGIMAIIDQKTNSRQGLPNYVLYSLAKSETFANCNSSTRTNPATGTGCIFNDVTAGNNTVPGETGFNARPGYDLATGLGSVDANNLANAWPGSFQGSQTALTIMMPGLVGGTLKITHGQTVVVQVDVQKAGTGAGPTGTVALVTDQAGPLPGTNLTVGGGALTGGSFTGAFTNLPGGSYNLSAHYPGDGTFGSSDSSLIPAVVTAEGSTTTLSSIIGFNNQGNPIFGTTIKYGGFLDLRTVVTSSTGTSPPDGFPSGTITIVDNAATTGTLKLDTQGQAELINCVTPAPNGFTCLAVGTHNIQITYGGDSSFNSSATAGPTVITVNKVAPAGTLTAPTIATFNTPITLSVQVDRVEQVLPTGTVQFFQVTTPLGPPVTLTPGFPSTASAQVTLTGTGPQSITAQYSGDTTYTMATYPNTVVVSPPFNLAAGSTGTSQTIAAGGTATYNVNLSAVGGFTGQVSFNCVGAPGGSTCTVSPNPATLGTSVPLTVTVSNTINARLAPSPFKTLPFVFAAAFAGLLWGVRKKPRRALFMVLGLALIVGLGSCGGGNPPPPPPRPPTTAVITVQAISGSATNSISLDLTITH